MKEKIKRTFHTSREYDCTCRKQTNIRLKGEKIVVELND